MTLISKLIFNKIKSYNPQLNKETRQYYDLYSIRHKDHIFYFYEHICQYFTITYITIDNRKYEKFNLHKRLEYSLPHFFEELLAVIDNIL